MTFDPGWYHAEGDPAGTLRAWNGLEWVGEAQPDPNAHQQAAVAVAVAPVAQSVPITQAAPAAQVYAKGFYHAPGDPEGTVRLWSGTDWVGYPVRDPNFVNEHVGVRPFKATPGQVPLRPFAIAAQLALVLVIIVYGFRMYITMQERSYRQAVANNDLLGIDLSADQLDRLLTAQTALWIVAVFFLMLFGTIWFWRAVRNMRLWHKMSTRGSVLTRYSPMNLMLELQTHSPRKEDEGILNPALAWGWWALFAGAGAVERSLERTSLGDSDSAIQFLGIRMFLIAGTIISFVLAIILVQQISKQQDRRLRPDAAQRALMKQQQADQASLEADPYRTNADLGTNLYRTAGSSSD